MDDLLKRLDELLEEKKKRDFIERLKEEKMVKERGWRDLGVMRGRKEAFELGYTQFIEIENLQWLHTRDPDADIEFILRTVKGKIGR